jgi:hypothetical protein
MSHFAVMVIGGDVEKQLQPFHEFECTGTNDEFVQDVDITEEVRGHMQGDEPMSLSEALEYEGINEDKIVGDESEVLKTGEEPTHKWGYAIVKDGQLIKAVNRTNPNKQWDWWVVGGRWSGFLKLKQGAHGELGNKGLMGSCANDGPGRADHAVKGAIDFEGMRQEAGDEAAERWDKAAAIHGGKTWDTWEHTREVLHKGNINAAREHYNNQEIVKALSQVFTGFFVDLDQYQTPRDEFIQQARDKAAVLYAVVKDGKWIAKGEMGWFGMSDEKVSQEDWNREVNKMLDELPDDTLITVVDCHI